MSSYNYLDKTGLSALWAKIKGIVPTKVSDLTNDFGYVTTDTNTTYVISRSNNVITLTDSDGQSSTIILPIYDESVTESQNGGS